MNRLLAASLTLIPFIAASHLGATISPVVEYDTASELTDDRAFTLGYEFNLSSTFDITALGYWAAGIGGGQQVGLWDTSGDLLASTAVSSSDPTVGHFQYHAISDLILGPGNYVIAGTYEGGPFPFQASGVTSQPGYTWITDEQSFGSGLNFPTISTSGGYGPNGIFEVDFATGTAATPEPGFYGLLALGFAGFAAALRRRRFNQ